LKALFPTSQWLRVYSMLSIQITYFLIHCRHAFEFLRPKIEYASAAYSSITLTVSIELQTAQRTYASIERSTFG
jgi:hypothetical protein